MRKFYRFASSFINFLVRKIPEFLIARGWIHNFALLEFGFLLYTSPLHFCYLREMSTDEHRSRPTILLVNITPREVWVLVGGTLCVLAGSVGVWAWPYIELATSGHYWRTRFVRTYNGNDSMQTDCSPKVRRPFNRHAFSVHCLPLHPLPLSLRGLRTTPKVPGRRLLATCCSQTLPTSVLEG